MNARIERATGREGEAWRKAGVQAQQVLAAAAFLSFQAQSKMSTNDDVLCAKENSASVDTTFSWPRSSRGGLHPFFLIVSSLGSSRLPFPPCPGLSGSARPFGIGGGGGGGGCGGKRADRSVPLNAAAKGERRAPRSDPNKGKKGKSRAPC